MTDAGRLVRRLAIGCCATVSFALAACSEPDDAGRDDDRDDAAPSCLTDLSTPTASYDVEVTDDIQGVNAFLTADAAVVQVLDDDSDHTPHVLGDHPDLQAALDGAEVEAVAGAGFLVKTVDPDAPDDEGASLSIVDHRGEILVEGPRIGSAASARAVGDQFVVVDGERDLATYDVATGREAEPSKAITGDGLTFPGIGSSIVLTDEGESGGLIDARTSRTFGLDDLLDDPLDEDMTGEVTDISISGNGADRILVRGERDDRTSRLWTWSSADGVREVYTTHDEDSVGERSSLGVCDDYLYLVEDDELKVVDTAPDAGGAVLSRRPMPMDQAAGQGYNVLAIPGGVLVLSADKTPGTFGYTWFDG